MSKSQAGKVAICFLVPGCLYAPEPEGFAEMTAEEKAVWAQDVLGESSDLALAEALQTSEDGGFDETPEAAALEDGNGNTLVTTPAWTAYIHAGAFAPLQGGKE